MSEPSNAHLLQGAARVSAILSWIAFFFGLLLPIRPPATWPMILSTFGVSLLTASFTLFAAHVCNHTKPQVSRIFVLLAYGAILSVLFAVFGPLFKR